MLDNNDFHLLVRTPRNAMFSEGMYLEYAFKKREREGMNLKQRGLDGGKAVSGYLWSPECWMNKDSGKWKQDWK